MSTTTLSRLLNVDDPLKHLARFMTVGAAGVGLGWNFLLNHFWTFRLIGERGQP